MSRERHFLGWPAEEPVGVHSSGSVTHRKNPPSATQRMPLGKCAERFQHGIAPFRQAATIPRMIEEVSPRTRGDPLGKEGGVQVRRLFREEKLS
jgi:hypothetical protein